MASWIWMKGVNGDAIADPNASRKRQECSPLRQGSHRRGHRATIDQVKSELKRRAFLRAEQTRRSLDCSFPAQNKIKAAVKAAKYTLAFQKEHGFDEQDLRAFPPGKNAKSEALSQRFPKYFSDDGMFFVLPDAQRGVIAFFRLTSIDQQHELAVKNVSEDDWLPSFSYCT